MRAAQETIKGERGGTTHIELGLQLLEDPPSRLEARVLDPDVVVVLHDALVEVEEDVGRGLGEPDAGFGVQDGGRAYGLVHGGHEAGLLLRGGGLTHSGVGLDRAKQRLAKRGLHEHLGSGGAETHHVAGVGGFRGRAAGLGLDGDEVGVEEVEGLEEVLGGECAVADLVPEGLDDEREDVAVPGCRRVGGFGTGGGG
jgi:hypothetical protein